MQYLEVSGPNRAVLRDELQPELRSGEARVKVAYCGLCTSDTEAIADFQGPANGRFGHEVAGTIVEAPGGSPLAVGTRVVALAATGYASEIAVPVEQLIPIPDNVDLSEACLAEPVACILSGIDRIDLANVERICQIGSGFMGLLALEVLVGRGHRVTVVEPRKAAQEYAVRKGAAEILEAADAESLGPTFDVVLECSGTQGGLDLAGTLAAIEGQLVIVGYHQSGGGVRTVDMKTWNYRCVRVINAHIRSEERILLLIRRALAMMSAGTLRPSDLVTKALALDELPGWLESGEEKSASSIKTIVRGPG